MKRVLIIGSGSIGRRHAANLAPLADVAICDPNAAALAQLPADLAIARYDNMDAALRRHKPEAAIVATPNHLHVEVATAMIEAGCDVLVEKPISHTIADVIPFLERAEALGRKILVACNMRYHPAIRAMRNALPSIGVLRFARAWYGNYLPDMRPGADYRQLYCANRSMGGGVILDAIHEIDYLVWLLGPVVKVACEADRLSDMEIDVEDYAIVSLQHQHGARSEIHLDYLQRYKQRGCELVGQGGTLTWRSMGKRPEICEVKIYTAAAGAWTTLFQTDNLDNNQPYIDMMRAFLRALDGEDSIFLTGRQALHDLRIAMAAHRAAETDRSQPL